MLSYQGFLPLLLLIFPLRAVSFAGISIDLGTSEAQHQRRRNYCRPQPRTFQPKKLPLFMSATDENGQPMSAAEAAAKRLLLNQKDIQQQMAQLRSKYPTSEAEYLAASRRRAELKVESAVDTANDNDWKAIADQKRAAMGAEMIDDWENSRKDEGNADSQVLLFMDSSEGEGGEGDDNEPKLLLF